MSSRNGRCSSVSSEKVLYSIIPADGKLLYLDLYTKATNTNNNNIKHNENNKTCKPNQNSPENYQIVENTNL